LDETAQVWKNRILPEPDIEELQNKKDIKFNLGRKILLLPSSFSQNRRRPSVEPEKRNCILVHILAVLVGT